MRQVPAALVAFLCGFAVMGLELTAVRLLAPYFGDSAYVWTNVIGVMLVALALGAFLGGRMADRELGRDRLFWLLLTAGLLVSLVPVLARPLGSWLLPSDLPLDAAMAALVRGSLGATTILFALPVLLVGCVTPMLVALVAKNHGRVGGASGLVSALSTLGSLAGTFAATHLLIPGVGSRWTVWICAGLLLATALICRLHRPAVLSLLLPLGLGFLPLGPLRQVRAGEELLAEVESSHQYLQVLRSQEHDAASGQSWSLLQLKINEGLDSFHSVEVVGSPYTKGMYYDYHVAAPYLAGDGKRPEPLRVLSLGAAAGTYGRLYAHVYPGCSLDAVEIDPQVSVLGRRYFGKGGAARVVKHEVFALDARVYVEQSHRSYEVVLVDAYEHQIYIPSHVASRQFFEAVERRLVDGGVVSVNAGGISFGDPVLRALCLTMARVFGEACAFRVPRSRNFVLAARKGRRIDPSVLGRVSAGEAELEAILAEMGKTSAWRVYAAGEALDFAQVLDDDRPLLDVLQEQAYRHATGELRLLVIAGSAAAAQVEAEARRLRVGGQPEDALSLIRTAQKETSQLRYLAGDCRWLLRDPLGARLEYLRAQELGIRQDWLTQRIQDAGADGADFVRAADLARRNAWLAGMALGLLFLGALAYEAHGHRLARAAAS